MLLNITNEMMAAVGASSKDEFSAKLSEFVAESNRVKNIMSEQTTDLAAALKRIEALEKNIVTEARISELVDAGAASAVSKWAASDEGKKAIGAEASKMTVSALAAIGTTPAKPSPTPAAVDPDATIKALEAQGKFEEVFALLPKAEQRQHFNAKSYAAFRRASIRGQVRLNHN